VTRITHLVTYATPLPSGGISFADQALSMRLPIDTNERLEELRAALPGYIKGRTVIVNIIALRKL
jgi:hypothetical protein